ncbi:MAG: hypothetical protein AVDCRST_MAG18-446 [uncultured Thermomicrobiales bacterium]|uniref:Uncharacterized protein n=1 Tax=uncultured Thermomicrobiales bacterium TaxID=1645740 RepID=A0A6J4ULE3_9BACT|nr:MAG: hypothetical protein AVDCRST_MAG18-446 [uncultured Thermomicrobiales bacterium]
MRRWDYWGALLLALLPFYAFSPWPGAELRGWIVTYITAARCGRDILYGCVVEVWYPILATSFVASGATCILIFAFGYGLRTIWHLR